MFPSFWFVSSFSVEQNGNRGAALLSDVLKLPYIKMREIWLFKLGKYAWGEFTCIDDSLCQFQNFLVPMLTVVFGTICRFFSFSFYNIGYSFFKKVFIFKLCVCVSVSVLVGTCKCRFLERSDKSIGTLGAGVTDTCCRCWEQNSDVNVKIYIF